MTEEKQKQPKEKLKNKYIFPDFLGRAMAKVSMRAQLESAMLSQALLCIGMILMGVYMALFMPQPLWFRISLLLNIICGFVLMSSYLVTTFQQYQNHMDVMGLDADAERAELKKKGNIFKRIKIALAKRKMRKAEQILKEPMKVSNDKLIMRNKESQKIKELTEEELREIERRTIDQI